MAKDSSKQALSQAIGALRDKSPRVEPAEVASVAGHQRVRQPEARFRVDDLMALSNAELLRVVVELDPEDLVLICGSRGAGELTERLFALVPDGVGTALIGALKAHGRPDDDEAKAALQRAAIIVAEA